MKTFIILLSGICLLSTTVNAQSAEKKQVKIERKEVVLLKKAPVKLERVQPTEAKKTTTNPIDKTDPKKKVAVAVEPKK